ncbi:glycosyltransferase family 4 protein [Sediminispirochaeta bajacaliforniensis]|uniref:glycosyltransferase family 4 protein n=1 Tax=Sediminispirochaeta bajacaliforniensis TaxID=148 RepID=UPI00036AA365|nr:glycosyltransferase family 4 protein [Sediminispirochaeta bajacaliforniensis]
MRILFIVSSLGPGGAERVLSSLANSWSKRHEISVLTLRSPQHDFYVLAPEVNRVSLDIERKYWYWPWAHWAIIRGIRKTADRLKPDFVVSFVIKTNIFCLLAKPKEPLVVCEHSILDRADIDWRQEFLRKHLYGRAFKIGVLTDSIRSSFMQRYPDIDAKKVVVLPNPVSFPDASAIHKISSADLFPSENIPVKIIVSLGRLVPIKGFLALIKAFVLCYRKIPETRLVIFGDGPERKKLETAIPANLTGKILLPGITDNPAGVLAVADLYAVSSRFEGFPMGIVEALSSGVSCVGFDVPGVRDVVESGKTGLLVPHGKVEALADAMIRLLSNPTELTTMGQEAREIAAKYSPDKVDTIWFERVFVHEA